MTRKENRLFGRHFENGTISYFIFFIFILFFFIIIYLFNLI